MPSPIIQNMSIILPAKNEADSLPSLLPEIRNLYPHAELIVVNDGSTDGTVDMAKELADHVFSHPASLGNGAAIKTGARKAAGDVIVFMDADGQHKPDDIQRLLEHLGEYDMVIGARDSGSQASMGRSFANKAYNRLASYITGHKIPDLTSGFRAVRRDKFREFLHLLPNGFSYPTTITMSFFRAGYPVKYIPIKAEKRIGKSHISPIKDGARFLIIILKIGTLYSPLKLFLPLSTLFFFLSISYYAYTYFSDGRFTNMGVLLFVTSILIFLVGLVSEQITGLLYANKQ